MMLFIDVLIKAHILGHKNGNWPKPDNRTFDEILKGIEK